MRSNHTKIPYNVGSGLTPLGKKLLIAYTIIYVIELLMVHWVKTPFVFQLLLFPFQTPEFHIWQVLTHPFIQNLSPIYYMAYCLMFYFFARPAEYVLGRKRFLFFFYGAALVGAVCGLGLSRVSGFAGPFSGMLPSLLALIVYFGLLTPESTILLMFIIPVKAKYLSYGTIAITLLTFLAKANPHGAYHMGGALVGYLYGKGHGGYLDPELIRLKYLQWRLKKKYRRFTVIDGHKKNDPGKNDDHITYH